MKVLFLVSLVVTMCNAFLIDRSTSNPLNSGFPMTDKHYYTLMDIVTDESKKRRQLQEFVVQLQNDFLTLKSENEQLKSTIKAMTFNSINVHNLDNKTDTLQLELAEIKSEYNSMKQAFQKLQTDNRQLQTDNQQLTKDNLATQNKLIQFNRQIDSLKQLKAIRDLTEMQHLVQDIQNTNSKVNVLISDGNARKEDFMALYNKTVISERKMSEFAQDITQKYSGLQTLQNTTFTTCLSKISDVETRLQTLNSSTIYETKNLSENQISIQATLSSAVTEISQINEKAAMTACGKSPTSYTFYKAYEVMNFPDIKEAAGIQITDEFKSFGKIVVKTTGLYIIEAHIDTGSVDAVFQIRKNNAILTYVQVTSDSGSLTGSGLATAQLAINDTIYILTGGNPINAYSDFSCMTIVKVK